MTNAKSSLLGYYWNNQGNMVFKGGWGCNNPSTRPLALPSGGIRDELCICLLVPTCIFDLGHLVSSSYLCIVLSPSLLMQPFYMVRKVYCCPGDPGQLGVVQGLGFQGETRGQILCPRLGNIVDFGMWQYRPASLCILAGWNYNLMPESTISPPSGTNNGYRNTGFLRLHCIILLRTRALNTDPDPAFQVNPDPDPI